MDQKKQGQQPEGFKSQQRPQQQGSQQGSKPQSSQERSPHELGQQKSQEPQTQHPNREPAERPRHMPGRRETGRGQGDDIANRDLEREMDEQEELPEREESER
jgi:hypothetical protein